MTAEQILQMMIGAQVIQIAVVTAERDQLREQVARLQAPMNDEARREN